MEYDAKEKIDAEIVRRQTQSMAQHLRRVGVSCLPNPNAVNVEQLVSQMSFGDESPLAGAIVQQSPSPTRVAEPVPSSPVTTPVNSGPPSTFELVSDLKSNDAAYPIQSLDIETRNKQLAQLETEVASCTKCEVLSKCRTKTVFGEGTATPRIVFFGEGPGRDEDLSGRPFVGKAGQLLTKMIEACKFRRDDVYIMNTVKCRPPNNRNPEPSEVDNCRPYFESQLRLLQPEYIVCLGLVGAQSLLKSTLSVGRMRGKFHHYFASKVVVTYHPAYLLRTPAAKKAAWDDLQMMMRDAGLL